MQRIRVSGNCVESVEEDLCTRIEHKVKKVNIIRGGDHIHVELVDCSAVKGSVLQRWLNIDIWHDNKVYRFKEIVWGQAPMVAGPMGFNMFDAETAVAVVFEVKSQVN